MSFCCSKVINRDEKAACGKVSELKGKLKEAKAKAQGNCKGKARDRGKGKGKEFTSKEVEDLKARLVEAERNMIKGTMNDKTVDPPGLLSLSLKFPFVTMQVYYGNTIRAHTNNLVEMNKACWAVFYHSISIDENPQHHCCPEGAESWCKYMYQCALALNQDAPLHTPKISVDLEKYVKPIICDLRSEDLLEKCLLGATQNRSESFNSLIWARAPKTEYVTRPTVEVAVSQAVLVFNSDRQALLEVMKRLRLHPGPLCCNHFAAQDSLRVKKSVS